MPFPLGCLTVYLYFPAPWWDLPTIPVPTDRDLPLLHALGRTWLGHTQPCRTLPTPTLPEAGMDWDAFAPPRCLPHTHPLAFPWTLPLPCGPAYPHTYPCPMPPHTPRSYLPSRCSCNSGFCLTLPSTTTGSPHSFSCLCLFFPFDFEFVVYCCARDPCLPSACRYPMRLLPYSSACPC